MKVNERLVQIETIVLNGERQVSYFGKGPVNKNDKDDGVSRGPLKPWTRGFGDSNESY